MSDDKPGFDVKDLPNAILGLFGIRTENEVPFKRIKIEDGCEIREIAAHTELCIKQKGQREEASNKSFDDLFAFIKGHNSSGHKYAMTSPVWQQQQDGDQWQTSFYLEDPKTRLPSPKDPRLHLVSVERKRCAVIRFSGNAHDDDVKAAILKLKLWMKKENLTADGEPRIAQFDQPFAVPFLRRNEIHIPLKN